MGKKGMKPRLETNVKERTDAFPAWKRLWFWINSFKPLQKAEHSYFSLADFIRNLFKQNKKYFSTENTKKI